MQSRFSSYNSYKPEMKEGLDAKSVSSYNSYKPELKEGLDAKSVFLL